LWAGRRDPETEHVVRTFTIVTTRANTRIAELHDRMPVVLGEDAWNRWLGREPAAAGELRAMLEPTEIDLEIYPVVRLVNDVRNDGPELIARLAG
jgi:putative SOS response-associated peptidase YedK